MDSKNRLNIPSLEEGKMRVKRKVQAIPSQQESRLRSPENPSPPPQQKHLKFLGKRQQPAFKAVKSSQEREGNPQVLKSKNRLKNRPVSVNCCNDGQKRSFLALRTHGLKGRSKGRKWGPGLPQSAGNMHTLHGARNRQSKQRWHLSLNISC